MARYANRMISPIFGLLQEVYCFYIQNYKTVIGKNRVDLTTDPAPDLALEIDLTSRTELDAYEALEVPELWIYADGKLKINLLREGKYIESQASLTFPNIEVIKIIPQFMQRAKQVGVISCPVAYP